RYAVRVGRDSTKVTDADVETLRNHGYTDGQILEATLVVAHFSGLNRLADALGVEFDDNIA
ncbi:MAG: peroxidase, partial [Nitrospinaceae bacterium]|nr:peroxidase [Nitrospinaceae bacterium]NIR57288.1 peroxidase [Nitrospinaceae bacterium]NIS87740.1 peroxidase [Nitrospinaceae bacterium]NIT80806.1 peroxidase [Nitrospinaceae bacterium]NIU46789.1 peroxidase [Nitrospinaceae bacterium]